MTLNVQKEIKTFRDKVAEEIYQAGIEIFAETPNTKDRAKGKTLEGSRLSKVWSVEKEGKGFLFVLPFYYIYIERGRRVEETKVPIIALIEWMKRNNIQGRDSKGRFEARTITAGRIREKIYQQGIPARPFVDRIIERSFEKIEKVINPVLLQGGLLDRIFINELDKIGVELVSGIK